jgi:hypothetical protein
VGNGLTGTGGSTFCEIFVSWGTRGGGLRSSGLTGGGGRGPSGLSNSVVPLGGAGRTMLMFRGPIGGGLGP